MYCIERFCNTFNQSILRTCCAPASPRRSRGRRAAKRPERRSRRAICLFLGSNEQLRRCLCACVRLVCVNGVSDASAFLGRIDLGCSQRHCFCEAGGASPWSNPRRMHCRLTRALSIKSDRACVTTRDPIDPSQQSHRSRYGRNYGGMGDWPGPRGGRWGYAMPLAPPSLSSAFPLSLFPGFLLLPRQPRSGTASKANDRRGDL